MDGGLHFFPGSSSVPLPDCFASGDGGFVVCFCDVELISSSA